MTDIAVILGGLVALILGVLGYGQIQKREGRKEAETDAREADQDRARDIRNRVRDAGDGVRDYSDRGFRD